MDIDTTPTLGDADAALEDEAAISDQVLRLAGIALLALGVAGAYAILTA
ncbi:MAG: hypothetical protein ACKOD0_07365 [Actinomycetota bacterium]